MRHRSNNSHSDSLPERQHALLLAISRAQLHVIQHSDPELMFALLLRDFVALTESEFGFIGEILHRPNGAPYLKTQAISNIAWNEQSRALYEKQAAEGLEFDRLDNLFGAAVSSGAAVIANDPSHDPRRRHLPPGHPKLDAFLGLPVYSGTDLVGLVGVANRAGGYDQEIADYLSPLLKTYGQIIVSLQQERQRHLAEQRLRESEERFRILVENAADAFFLHERSGKIIDVNRRACEALGYTREELLQLNVVDVDRDATAAEVEEVWQRLAQGEKICFERVHRRKDGSQLPVSLSMAQFQSGDKTLMLALARDISQAKETEQKLRQAIAEMEQRVKERTAHLTQLNASLQAEISNHLQTQQQLTLERDFNATVFQTVAALIVVLDPECRIVKLNRACETTSGFTTEQVRGQTFWQTFICAEEAASIERHLLAAVKDGIDNQLHTSCWQVRQGEARLISWAHANLRAPDGKIEHLIVTGIDITERHAAESQLKEHLRQLRASEQRYRELFENMAQGVVYQDSSGRVISANPAAERILGLSLAQMQGRTSFDPNWRNIHEDGSEFPGHEHPSMLALHSGRPVSETVMGIFNPRSEQIRWLSIDAIPQFKEGEDKPYQVFTTFSDITERKMAQDKLRLSAVVVENSGDAILIGNAEGKLIAINRAYRQMTGFSEDEILGQPIRALSADETTTDICHAIMATVSKQGEWKGEILIERKRGDTFPAWATVSAVYDDQGRLTHCVSVAADISSIKQSQQQLDFLAYHDPLTHLPNRLLLDDRLNHALQRARRERTQTAVLFLDLDRFKNINDSLGHPVGDMLLKQVAQRLRSLVRDNDTVARLGGDEFVIVIEEIGDAVDIAALAQKIISDLSRPFEVRNYQLHLSVSIGISLYPSDGQDAATLIKNADAAMYHAKEEGRNAYHFYTLSLTNAVFERLTMETALRHALDRHELVLHYQPQVDSASGTLIGIEALVRWNHPELGLVYPSKFITLAEETGLIIPLGEWVLWSACRQMQAWCEAGMAPAKISVNVSGVQFHRGAIVETIQRILDQTGLAAARLELEITESVIMQKTDWTIETLQQLKQMGLSMSIDDFGTGYSSLSYLKRMPVDKLKIDQSFIRDLPYDSNDEAIARAIIALAESLQLVVIAEGVETEEQRERLQQMGCHLFQGWLFSTPVSALDAGEYMRGQMQTH